MTLFLPAHCSQRLHRGCGHGRRHGPGPADRGQAAPCLTSASVTLTRGPNQQSLFNRNNQPPRVSGRASSTLTPMPALIHDPHHHRTLPFHAPHTPNPAIQLAALPRPIIVRHGEYTKKVFTTLRVMFCLCCVYGKSGKVCPKPLLTSFWRKFGKKSDFFYAVLAVSFSS